MNTTTSLIFIFLFCNFEFKITNLYFGVTYPLIYRLLFYVYDLGDHLTEIQIQMYYCPDELDSVNISGSKLIFSREDWLCRFSSSFLTIVMKKN